MRSYLFIVSLFIIGCSDNKQATINQTVDDDSNRKGIWIKREPGRKDQTICSDKPVSVFYDLKKSLTIPPEQIQLLASIDHSVKKALDYNSPNDVTLYKFNNKLVEEHCVIYKQIADKKRIDKWVGRFVINKQNRQPNFTIEFGSFSIWNSLYYVVSPFGLYSINFLGEACNIEDVDYDKLTDGDIVEVTADIDSWRPAEVYLNNKYVQMQPGCFSGVKIISMVKK